MQSDVQSDVRPDMHPAILQSVALTLRPTQGDAVALETKVLDLETQPDGSTTLVVACPAGLDTREHHLDATVAWTYPLGRMECSVSTRPGRRAYGDVWLLHPVTPVSRLQQRSFFRARVSIPVLIRWEVDPDPRDSGQHDDPTERPEQVRRELLGVGIDISEGGALATVSVEPPPLGTLVDSVVRVDGESLEQPARIVRHVRFASGGFGVAIEFTEPARHGDRIRRLVCETERRRRRRQ